MKGLAVRYINRGGVRRSRAGMFYACGYPASMSLRKGNLDFG